MYILYIYVIAFKGHSNHRRYIFVPPSMGEEIDPMKKYFIRNYTVSI